MVDRYHMGRIKLDHYFIRDGFSEYSGRFGYASIYFWQSKTDPTCTVKVHASATDSNAVAHDAMKQFKALIPDPGVLVKLDKSVTDGGWFKATHAEDVSFVNAGSEQRMVVLIWGNIFFQIESIGEHAHSVRPFLEDLGNNWVRLDSDDHQQADFELFADKTGVRDVDVVTLSRKGPDDEFAYSSFLYIAGPRERVQIYREKGVYKLKFNALKGVSDQPAKSPFVLLIGVRPEGHYMRSNIVRFQMLS